MYKITYYLQKCFIYFHLLEEPTWMASSHSWKARRHSTTWVSFHFRKEKEKLSFHDRRKERMRGGRTQITQKSQKRQPVLNPISTTNHFLKLGTCLHQNCICLWNRSLYSSIYWHMQIFNSTVKLWQHFCTGLGTERLLFSWLYFWLWVWNKVLKAECLSEIVFVTSKHYKNPTTILGM